MADKEAKILTKDDCKSFLDKLRDKGLTDEKKLQGMLDKANKLAADDGKAGDKKFIQDLIGQWVKTKLKIKSGKEETKESVSYQYLDSLTSE